MTILITALLTTLVCTTVYALVDSLTPATDPDSTTSYTLADIYQRLVDGTAGSQSTFTEPATGPGGTMQTLNDIMDQAPALDETNGATAADVTDGKTFWGLTGDEWGLQTGTANSCAGTLTGTRWCDNGDGTVTDLTTGLVWMKNANCSATLGTPEISSAGGMQWNDAISWGSFVEDGVCGLSDGSGNDAWRLPTRHELLVLATDPEGISFSSSEPFTDVLDDFYWTSGAVVFASDEAWSVELHPDGSLDQPKESVLGVWPVRGAE